MKRLFNSLICLLVALPAAAQLQSNVQGIWQNNQMGVQMTLMLNADGTGEFDGTAITYTTPPNALLLSVGGQSVRYQCKVEGNQMTLSDGDLDAPLIFSRMGEDPRPVERGEAYSKTDRSLLGLWSGHGEMIDFKPDGTCVYLGNTFPYQISHDHVVLTTAQGPVSFQYQVKGSSLILTANGQQITYQKAADPSPGKQAVGRGAVAMELVGTWCYLNMSSQSQTSRCLTLQADGTYTFRGESSRSVQTETLYGGTSSSDGDSGTWYVQGDRIYYQSRTHGSGSYRLEKRNHPKNVSDPMIVLDGEPYVTATRRDPWR